MFSIEFNGKTNLELGVMVTTRPAIPPPQPRGEYVQIAGRDGALLVNDVLYGTNDTSYENIQIDVEMNYVRQSHKVGETFRAVKSWLRGGGTLVMSDDKEVFYKVKACSVTDSARHTKYGVDLVASFICDPYTYMGSGTQPMQLGNVYNPYDTSHPLYKITGNGTCTLTVNGNVVTANVGQNLTIDTDLFLAYRTDGTMQNSVINGDLNDLWLINGSNTMSVTSGFTVSIIPNWRVL